MPGAARKTDLVKTNQWNGDWLEISQSIYREEVIPFQGDFLWGNALPVERDPVWFGFVGLAHHHALRGFCESGAEDRMALDDDLPCLAKKIRIRALAETDRNLSMCTRSARRALVAVVSRSLHGIGRVLPHGLSGFTARRR